MYSSQIFQHTAKTKKRERDTEPYREYARQAQYSKTGGAQLAQSIRRMLVMGALVDYIEQHYLENGFYPVDIHTISVPTNTTIAGKSRGGNKTYPLQIVFPSFYRATCKIYGKNWVKEKYQLTYVPTRKESQYQLKGKRGAEYWLDRSPTDFLMFGAINAKDVFSGTPFDGREFKEIYSGCLKYLG